MYFFRQLSPDEMARAYDDVFREAFPPEELKPLASIEAMSEGGFYRACALFEDEKPVGYACLWLDEPYILIDYLCVPKALRNAGFGAKTLEAMMEAYPRDSIFIAEVEAPTGDAETDEIIRRRLGFYRRSGARLMGYDCALFGVHYNTIVWADGPVDEARVLRRHDGLYRRWFSPEKYAEAIQIPLGKGEAPFDRAVWDERPESEEKL